MSESELNDSRCLKVHLVQPTYPLAWILSRHLIFINLFIYSFIHSFIHSWLC